MSRVDIITIRKRYPGHFNCHLSADLSLRSIVCLIFSLPILQSTSAIPMLVCFDFIICSMFDHSMSQHTYNVSYEEMQTCISPSSAIIRTLSSQMSQLQFLSSALIAGSNKFKQERSQLERCAQ